MDTVKRQDMAAFLRREAVRRGLGDASSWKPAVADWDVFSDALAGISPHAEDVLWLAHAGVSTGWREADGSRTFRGMDTVKRQDMAAFLTSSGVPRIPVGVKDAVVQQETRFAQM